MVLKAEFVKHCAGSVSVKVAFQMNLGAAATTVLYGPAGCGKTAVIRVIAGIDRPEKGLVAADGKIWFQGDGRQAMASPEREVGFILKGDQLAANLTVASNLTLGLRKWPTRERGKRVKELLGLLGLPDMAKLRPSELNPLDRRRLLLARAVAPRPKVLLWDEPFEGLDPQSAEWLRQDLEMLLKAENLPVLISTADRALALRLGGRVMIMEQGRITLDGRAGEVLMGAKAKPTLTGAETVVRVRYVGRGEGLVRLDAGGVTLHAPDPNSAFETANLHICSEGVLIERPGPGLLGRRNALQGRVREMTPEGSMMRVRLDCGFPLEALISVRACHDLRLRTGDPVVARIKLETLLLVPTDGSLAAVRPKRPLAMAI